MAFFEIAGIVAAATVGDGAFALPFIFFNAGWAISLFYLLLLAALVSVAHIAYLKTLEAEGERKRLLGLAKTYFGSTGFWVGFLAIVIGLLLTLLAVLILGAQFIHLAFPGISARYAFIGFWLLISLVVFANDKELRELELVGIACTSLIIIFIFISAWPRVFLEGIPAAHWQNVFLPFGATLFALAGWTSIEPAYEARKRRGRPRTVWLALLGGSLFAAFLYGLFVAGIIGSASVITSDTASGLSTWPIWKKDLLATLGVIAVATVYLPISREIKNSLEHDLRWPKGTSRPLIILLPPVLALLGANNFLTIVGLVGGVFLSLQYLLIVGVSRKALKLGDAARAGLDIVALVFIVAAVYSVWQFIVR